MAAWARILGSRRTLEPEHVAQALMLRRRGGERRRKRNTVGVRKHYGCNMHAVKRATMLAIRSAGGMMLGADCSVLSALGNRATRDVHSGQKALVRGIGDGRRHHTCLRGFGTKARGLAWCLVRHAALHLGAHMQARAIRTAKPCFFGQARRLGTRRRQPHQGGKANREQKAEEVRHDCRKLGLRSPACK